MPHARFGGYDHRREAYGKRESGFSPEVPIFGPRSPFRARADSDLQPSPIHGPEEVTRNPGGESVSELSLSMGDDAFEAIVSEAVRRLRAELPAGETSPYLTVQEAAEYLRCSRQAIDDLLRRGELSRRKRGRCVLVLRSEVESLVRAEP